MWGNQTGCKAEVGFERQAGDNKGLVACPTRNSKFDGRSSGDSYTREVWSQVWFRDDFKESKVKLKEIRYKWTMLDMRNLIKPHI